jgi:hypothetical protein
MRSSTSKTGRKLSVVIVLALAMFGATVASASANIPRFEYTLPNSLSATGGQMVIESASGFSITCKSTSGVGTLTLTKNNPITLRFKECKTSGIIPCTSSGLASGEIGTNSIQTRLEYLSKASHEVGLIFNAEGKASTVATFVCAGITETMRGEFMAKITPVKVGANKFPLALSGTKGTPGITQYENESGEKVTLSPLEIGSTSFSKASLSATALSLVFASTAEIQA